MFLLNRCIKTIFKKKTLPPVLVKTKKTLPTFKHFQALCKLEYVKTEKNATAVIFPKMISHLRRLLDAAVGCIGEADVTPNVGRGFWGITYP